MSRADLTTLRPEPFEAVETPGGWAVVDAHRKPVCTCHGPDDWRNAQAIAGSLVVGSGRVKHPEHIEAEETIEALESDVEAEREDRRSAQQERDDASDERYSLEGQLSDRTEERDDGYRALRDLLAALGKDDEPRRQAIATREFLEQRRAETSGGAFRNVEAAEPGF